MRYDDPHSLAAAVVKVIVFFGLVWWIDVSDWGHGRARALGLLPVAAVAAAGRPSRPSRPIPEGATWLLFLAYLGLTAWHVGYFLRELPRPYLIDIGSATLRAGDAMLEGRNPYKLVIDPEPRSMPGLAHLTGYKYMPLMPIVYLPLGSVFRERGVLATNAVLDLATTVLVFLLGARLGGRRAGGLAAVLYLSVPLVPREVLGINATDLSAVIPLLAALLLVETNPALAGLSVGLSISVKLLPGVLFVPCCLPTKRRGSYAWGLLAGLIPVAEFLVISPREILMNAVVFNGIRPTDSTSWLLGTPRSFSTAARLAFATLGLAYSYRSYRKRDQPLSDRCAFGVLLILGSILSAPMNHRNYQVWWIPIFAALLAATSFGRGKATSRASVQVERC